MPVMSAIASGRLGAACISGSGDEMLHLHMAGILPADLAQHGNRVHRIEARQTRVFLQESLHFCRAVGTVIPHVSEPTTSGEWHLNQVAYFAVYWFAVDALPEATQT